MIFLFLDKSYFFRVDRAIALGFFVNLREFRFRFGGVSLVSLLENGTIFNMAHDLFSEVFSPVLNHLGPAETWASVEAAVARFLLKFHHEVLSGLFRTVAVLIILFKETFVIR